MRGTAGLPFLLREGDEVAFVPPQTDMPRRAHVEYLRLIDDNSAEVEFDCVGGAEAAELIGCHCLLRRDSLDEALLQEEPVFWDGWSVVDQKLGFIGHVSEIVQNPGQALLEVEREGADHAALVPIVDEIILDVDVEGKLIYVDLPSGLLEL